MIPDRRDYYPGMGSWMATGSAALDLASEMEPGHIVGLDIETAGLGAASFTVKCVTAAWDGREGTESILLDPRDPAGARAARELTDKADILVLHNATFDMPPMYHHGLISLEAMNKVTDTLVLARMAFPDTLRKKGLEDLAELAELEPTAVKMADVFRSAGYAKAEDGWRDMDIDVPVYRQGAMADTIVTLRLAGPLWEAARAQLTRRDYPDIDAGGDRPRRILTDDEADELVAREQVVNRTMLRRSAQGLAVDTDYLATYRERHAAEMETQASELTAAGIDAEAGNVGLLLVEELDRRGDLPDAWPRTKTGKLSATRGDLASLAGHPLVQAQQVLTEKRKVLGYLDKVADMAAVTGRCHPQVAILGASATGRMCLPVSHRLLTQRGAVPWDEVKEGDRTLDQHGQWVVVTGVHHYRDQETVIRRGRNVRLESTAEHRWVTRSEYGAVRVQPLADRRVSVLLTPEVPRFDPRGEDLVAATDGEKFAALVGMLVTDGRCVRGDDGLRAYVYQTEGKFYRQFLGAIPEEAVMYDRTTTGEHHEVRIKARWLRPRLEAAGLGGSQLLSDDEGLTAWALGLTPGERQCFLRAAYMADGVRSPSQGRRITCDRPEVRKVIATAAYLSGWRIHTRTDPPSAWGTKDRVELVFTKRPVSTRHLSTEAGRGDVWCVTTTSGTFTAWDGERPYLTGNSYSWPELQQFPADARPILVPDEGQEWTSLDWKQIEPVVAALMARDEAFLAPFEAGADLYAPVQESAGISRKHAKVVVLALMYGMGLEALAKDLGVTEEEALTIQRGVIRGMPATADFLGLARSTAEKSGLATTASGRMLDVPRDPRTGVIFAAKAANYVVQSSAYDVLAEAIVGTEAAGLGDSIQLALHDELVVTTEHAAEIKAIMETPPDWLTMWADRTPTIRVDENPMGGAWRYV